MQKRLLREPSQATTNGPLLGKSAPRPLTTTEVQWAPRIE